jgi:hypothetical protein
MRRFLAMICGSIFVMLLVLTTLALSLRSFAFDANFYVATLKAQGVFQQLERNPLGVIDLSDQIPQLATVPADLQQRIVTTILPGGWLEKQAASAIDAWLTWFVDGQIGTPEIQIDLRQIRDRLQGPPGQQVAQEVINAIPTCAENQQPPLSLTQLPECIPAVFDREVVAERVAAMLDSAAAQMPGQYNIGPRLAPSTRFGPLFNGRRVGVELLNTSLLLLVVVTIGAWVISALLGAARAGKTSRQLRRRETWMWFGGLLLIGSIAVLGVSLFILVFGATQLPQTWLADLPAEGAILVRGLMQAVVQQLALRSLIAGSVWFALAWGMILLGILQNPHQTALQQRGFYKVN